MPYFFKIIVLGSPPSSFQRLYPTFVAQPGSRNYFPLLKKNAERADLDKKPTVHMAPPINLDSPLKYAQQTKPLQQITVKRLLNPYKIGLKKV